MSCCLCCFGRSKARKTKMKQQQQQVDQELTKESPFKHSTIEELKTKLGNKETVDSEPATGNNMIPETQKGGTHTPSPPLLTEEGLIMPRKPANPVLENSERQNLHRELLFNQKIGKNVLNQKSELQRALEKHKENVAKKEQMDNVSSRTPELDKVIADRAKRLQDTTNGEHEDEKGLSKEILEVKAKLRARIDSK